MSEDREQDVSKADPDGLADLLGEGLAGGPAVPEIVVFRDGVEVTRRPLDMSPIHVGRHPGNELVLDDQLVSRRHAVITRELGQWWIRDAGSRHKLRVGDKQREAHAFKDGDCIGIGPFELAYQAAPATETVSESAWSADGSSGAEDHGWPMATLPVEIPGYRIEREIGRGGMGRVFEAVQLSTQRTVALKVMLEGPFSSEKTKRRFEREVHIVAGLRHPHIAQIYESGLHQGRYWFAMEFVEGQPLDLAADTGKLSVGQKLAVMAMVCEAVGYAHEHNVVHRDLKPTNMLVSDDGQPHILDFGLAKIEDPERYHEITLSAPGELMGTPAYMSPEQTERDPGRVDARTDVYSLGVNLYKLLTGQFPYDVRGRLDEVIRQIATAEPTPPSDILREVDDETEAITLKALAKNPDDRYASAAEMAEDLRRRIAGEPVEAKLTSRSYVLGKALARHRKLLVTAGVLAAAVAGTAFVTHALLGPGDEPPQVVVAPESSTLIGQQEKAAQTDEPQAERASGLVQPGRRNWRPGRSRTCWRERSSHKTGGRPWPTWRSSGPATGIRAWFGNPTPN